MTLLNSVPAYPLLGVNNEKAAHPSPLSRGKCQCDMQLLMRPNERLPPPLPPSPQDRDAYTASIQWPT